MQLQQIASFFLASRLVGDGTTAVGGVQSDSRRVQPGDLFLCIPGLVSDGHDYAAKAAASGAAALVVERLVPVELPQLIVPDARYAMAVIASHFYRHPSKSMQLIGITGTNGKTTTATLIEALLREEGKQTGLMGTVVMKIGDTWTESERTTQEATDLQRNLALMRDVGTDYCVMEVSSHALSLGRVKGCRFRTAIFTNLTQDHLDFHETMEAYRDAKGLLFSRLGNTFSDDPAQTSYAVLNADDAASGAFAAMTTVQVIRYGIEQEAEVRASDIQLTAQGTTFRVNVCGEEAVVQMRLVGLFNVYNMLAAIAAVWIEGIPLASIVERIAQLDTVPGRMEVIDEGQPYLVVVDYAHTPDGLENALKPIRSFCEGNVITVFGCGGDRDRAKRPMMGRIAASHSDYVIVTSDNPRSEDPLAILAEIEPGLAEGGIGAQQYRLIADRREAIEKAVEMASPNDVVLIAGKGHETYQIVGQTRHHFDDRLVAREAIRSRAQ